MLEVQWGFAAAKLYPVLWLVCLTSCFDLSAADRSRRSPSSTLGGEILRRSVSRRDKNASAAVLAAPPSRKKPWKASRNATARHVQLAVTAHSLVVARVHRQLPSSPVQATSADHPASRPEQATAAAFPGSSLANTSALLETSSAGAAVLSSRSASRSVAASSVQMIPGVIGPGDMMKYAAYCFVCMCIYKFVSSIDPYSRKLDPRRCKPIAKFLRESGYDEFDSFDVRVTVHCIADVANEGMMGGKKNFQVDVGFYWSKWSTTPVADMRWEQTKSMHVPQGAATCFIQLVDVGTLTNAIVGTFEYDTKFHMLDKEEFWGKKQKVKLRDDKDKTCGVLYLTVNKKGEGGSDIPIAGVDEDSPLAMELIKEYQVMLDTPGFVPPADGKLKGDDRLQLLAKILQGTLREIDGKGKDKGLTFVRVMHCNFAELQGDSMEKEMAKQVKKAREKGLPDIQKKWYWVWYEDEKSADHDKKKHYPDGFIPLISFASVHRSPERNDQFVVKYHGGKVDFIIYRQDKKEKALETWTDALEMIFVECRDAVKKEKEEEQRRESALERMRKMHQEYEQENGFPQTAEQWKAWYTHFETNRYPSDYVKILYSEIMKNAPPPAASAGEQGGAPGAGSAAAGADAKGGPSAKAAAQQVAQTSGASRAMNKRMPPPAPSAGGGGAAPPAPAGGDAAGAA
eukprot:TRINITY_DN76646_c0_g1_i1.p1 TRINITY_DN76646_c0_g1~~TRINITY_DN76646_c0_g1_i1.p1  ORF type:complete len:684 (+),score=170.26 TRINITY_DN76646_c0_g1_i1:109-2160(+)